MHVIMAIIYLRASWGFFFFTLTLEREYVTGFQQTLLCGSELGALMLTHKLSKGSVAVKNRSVTQPVL